MLSGNRKTLSSTATQVFVQMYFSKWNEQEKNHWIFRVFLVVRSFIIHDLFLFSQAKLCFHIIIVNPYRQFVIIQNVIVIR